RMLAMLELGGVMRGQHVGDTGAGVPQCDRRIGIDPFGSQPLHLGAAFVEFDDSVAALDAGLRPVVLLLLLRVLHWHFQTILSVGKRLSSNRRGATGPRAWSAGTGAQGARARGREGMSPSARARAQAIGSDMPTGFGLPFGSAPP